MEHIEQLAITATQVPDDDRLGFLPRHFGAHMMIVERALYAELRQLCAEYRGGWWNFYDLSNGGCYLAPGGVETFHLQVPGNGFDGRLSADATGVTVTLFALSHLSFRFPSIPIFSDRFYQLRDFAIEHGERQLIFAAID
jgi:hypothetical protein